MGKIMIPLKTSDQEQIFHYYSKNAKICVVDFFADWCGPCKKLSVDLEKTLPEEKTIMEHVFIADKPTHIPEIEEIKDKIVILKIDIDVKELAELASQFKVQSIPHIIFYKNGKLQQGIARNYKQICDCINKLL